VHQFREQFADRSGHGTRHIPPAVERVGETQMQVVHADPGEHFLVFRPSGSEQAAGILG
jgi:hypothetical protein